MKGEHCVRLLCELLGVSSSGYYGWRQKRPSKRQREDAALAAKIALPQSELDQLAHLNR